MPKFIFAWRQNSHETLHVGAYLRKTGLRVKTPILYPRSKSRLKILSIYIVRRIVFTPIFSGSKEMVMMKIWSISQTRHRYYILYIVKVCGELQKRPTPGVQHRFRSLNISFQLDRNVNLEISVVVFKSPIKTDVWNFYYYFLFLNLSPSSSTASGLDQSYVSCIGKKIITKKVTSDNSTRKYGDSKCNSIFIYSLQYSIKITKTN